MGLGKTESLHFENCGAKNNGLGDRDSGFMTLGWRLIWCVTLNKSFISLGFCSWLEMAESWDHPSPCLLDWLWIQSSFLHPPLTGGHSLGFRICDLLFPRCQGLHLLIALATCCKVTNPYQLLSEDQSYLAKIFIGNFLSEWLRFMRFTHLSNSPRPHFNLYIGTTGMA